MKTLALPLLALTLLSGPVALAQDPSEEEKEKTAARELVLEGDRLFDASDFARAVDNYTAAYHLVRAPTVALRIAKAQASLGRLRQALASAEEASKLPVEPGEHPAFADARSKAAELARELVERIPVLELVIKPVVAGAEVRIDGGLLPKGSHWRLDPGAHRIRVDAPGHNPAQREISLAERARQRLEIVLEPIGGAKPVAAAASAPTPTPQLQAQPEPQSEAAPTRDLATLQEEASAARTRGYVGLTIAGIAAAGGGVMGGLAFKTKPDCSRDRCGPDNHDDLDNSLLYGNIANVCVGVAGVAALYGLYELIANGSVDTSEAASLPVSIATGPENLAVSFSGSF